MIAYYLEKFFSFDASDKIVGHVRFLIAKYILCICYIFRRREISFKQLK